MLNLLNKKMKPKVLPHYEKPEYSIGVDVAKKEYPRLWQQMSERIPYLTNEEKRRVVEIVENSCKHCWRSEHGCQCWNDE